MFSALFGTVQTVLNNLVFEALFARKTEKRENSLLYSIFELIHINSPFESLDLDIIVI